MTKLLHMLIVCLTLASFQVVAEEDKPKYTEPGELSSEDWENFREDIANYNICLRQEMVIKVKNGNDARLVSNEVLEACRFHLLDLQQKMLAKNLDPNFVDRYIYTNKNKSGRQMLGAIMVLMSRQQQEAEEAQNQENTEEPAD